MRCLALHYLSLLTLLRIRCHVILGPESALEVNGSLAHDFNGLSGLGIVSFFLNFGSKLLGKGLFYLSPVEAWAISSVASVKHHAVHRLNNQ